MAKTFVVSGVDYSTKALDTVSFINNNSVPCTAIELSSSTATVTNLTNGSITLTTTVTPSNTTDTVSWQSSDPTIISVTNGVLTAVAAGTATITATCGSYSATCTATSRIFLVNNILKIAGLWAGCDSYYKSGGTGLPYTDPSASRGIIVSSTGTLTVYDKDYYPFPIPSWATKIHVDVGSASLVDSSMIACSSTQAVSGNSTVALAIENVTATTSGTILEYAIPVETGNIPQVDCAIIVLRESNYSTVTDAMLEQVIVEFINDAS